MIDEIKIMQYVDGTLPAEEKEAVEKAIENNPEFKKLLKDYQETADVLFNLGKSIKSQPLPNSLKKKLKEINSWKESYAKKDRPGFFEAIFQKPVRNFIAYPIAAVFIFTLGFQINNYLPFFGFKAERIASFGFEAETITSGTVKAAKEEAAQEIKLAKEEAVQEIKLAKMEAEKEKEKAVKAAKEEVAQEIELAVAQAVEEALIQASTKQTKTRSSEAYTKTRSLASKTKRIKNIEEHLKYLYNKVEYLETALSEQTKLIDTYKKEIEKLNRRLQEKN